MNKTLEIYPACNISREGKAAHLVEWKAILDEIGEEAFDRALADHIRNSAFFPNVSELRERAGIAGDLRVQLEAEQAWQVVEQDLSRRGRDAPPGLSDRIEYAIRSVGGRRAIDRTFKYPDPTKESFKKKDFMQAFANCTAAERLGVQQLAAPVCKSVIASIGPLTRQLETRARTMGPTAKAKAKRITVGSSRGQLESRRQILKEQLRNWELSRGPDTDTAVTASPEPMSSDQNQIPDGGQHEVH